MLVYERKVGGLGDYRVFLLSSMLVCFIRVLGMKMLNLGRVGVIGWVV